MSWVTSPLVGLICSLLVCWVIEKTIILSDHPFERAVKLRPLLIGLTVGILLLFALMKGPVKALLPMWVIVVISCGAGLVFAVVAYVLFKTVWPPPQLKLHADSDITDGGCRAAEGLSKFSALQSAVGAVSSPSTGFISGTTLPNVRVGATQELQDIRMASGVSSIGNTPALAPPLVPAICTAVSAPESSGGPLTTADPSCVIIVTTGGDPVVTTVATQVTPVHNAASDTKDALAPGALSVVSDVSQDTTTGGGMSRFENPARSVFPAPTLSANDGSGAGSRMLGDRKASYSNILTQELENKDARIQHLMRVIAGEEENPITTERIVKQRYGHRPRVPACARRPCA